MSPKWTNLVLSSYVPDVEFDVLIRDSLDVESDSGDCSDRLVKLELVQDG